MTRKSLSEQEAFSQLKHAARSERQQMVMVARSLLLAGGCWGWCAELRRLQPAPPCWPQVVFHLPRSRVEWAITSRAKENASCFAHQLLIQRISRSPDFFLVLG
jgi:hypothetical protein